GGRPVVMMAGRFHYYEGYSMQQVTFPVRVMKFLGADKLLASNAAGGTREEVEMGDIVFIRDHINLLPDNPLRGPNDERLGPRFPDMSKPYDRTFNARGLALAPSFGLRAHEGVYVSLPGPNLETPAEYGFVHTIGGWVVGMSTVPEVLVARHMDMQVAVVSVVSNKCWPPEAIGEVTVEDVIAAVEAVAPRLRRLVTALVGEWRAGACYSTFADISPQTASIMRQTFLLVLACALVGSCQWLRPRQTVDLSDVPPITDERLQRVRLTDLEGRPIDLRRYHGKAVFLNFWATWCRPCLTEMASIEQLRQELDPADIVFLAASDEDAATIEAFRKSHPEFGFEFVRLEVPFIDVFVVSLPTTFLISP
ncbi:MAG: purine-nucleoside phosphorylase, partial [Bacteroidetes bacterium]